MAQKTELSVVLIGTGLKTSTRIGLMMYTRGGESQCSSYSKASLSGSLSHTSQENVQCVMGYIVNLTVILDGVFKAAAGSVTEDVVLKVTDAHVESGRRDDIHRDIRSFVTKTSAIRSAVPQKDLAFEKIVDFIKRYCAPP